MGRLVAALRRAVVAREAAEAVEEARARLAPTPVKERELSEYVDRPEAAGAAAGVRVAAAVDAPATTVPVTEASPSALQRSTKAVSQVA